MKKAVGILMFSLTGLVTQSCDNKSIEQEVQEYCDCQKEVLNGEREMVECSEIASQISDKYQFDPEAAQEVGEKIKNCAEELNDQND